jgi:hypothetical protein
LEKILLEYENFRCSKIAKEVTITSMVVKESNEAAAPDRDDKQAFDSDQKEHCGVLTISGKNRLINWTGCVWQQGNDVQPDPCRLEDEQD